MNLGGDRLRHKRSSNQPEDEAQGKADRTDRASDRPKDPGDRAKALWQN